MLPRDLYEANFSFGCIFNQKTSQPFWRLEKLHSKPPSTTTTKPYAMFTAQYPLLDSLLKPQRFFNKGYKF